VIVLDKRTRARPAQVVEFRRFLLALHGRRILFSSHIVSEVVAISDRLFLITENMFVLMNGAELAMNVA